MRSGKRKLLNMTPAVELPQDPTEVDEIRKCAYNITASSEGTMHSSYTSICTALQTSYEEAAHT